MDWNGLFIGDYEGLAAVGDGGRVRRVLCRCGVPDHILGLVAATPSLRRSWLLSVVGVLAVVAGEHLFLHGPPGTAKSAGTTS